jgi:hypothetical protein
MLAAGGLIVGVVVVILVLWATGGAQACNGTYKPSRRASKPPDRRQQ